MNFLHASWSWCCARRTLHAASPKGPRSKEVADTEGRSAPSAAPPPTARPASPPSSSLSTT
eukprot:8101855-Pyramimonas_sp.AAC.1